MRDRVTVSLGHLVVGRLGRGPGATHLQQLLEAKDLGHQHILLSAQLLPLQPFPLRLLVRLRELAVKPVRGE